jgi:hypothetical protein
VEIRKERGFPQPLQNPAGFRTFPTGPTAAVTHNGTFFSGGDPTLEKLIFCLKDGEYLKCVSRKNKAFPFRDNAFPEKIRHFRFRTMRFLKK